MVTIKLEMVTKWFQTNSSVTLPKSGCAVKITPKVQQRRHQVNWLTAVFSLQQQNNQDFTIKLLLLLFRINSPRCALGSCDQICWNQYKQLPQNAYNGSFACPSCCFPSISYVPVRNGPTSYRQFIFLCSIQGGNSQPEPQGLKLCPFHNHFA